MPNVNETVVRYLAAWNERDPKRRRELVAAAWTEEGTTSMRIVTATATRRSMRCLPRRRCNFRTTG